MAQFLEMELRYRHEPGEVSTIEDRLVAWIATEMKAPALTVVSVPDPDDPDRIQIVSITRDEPRDVD